MAILPYEIQETLFFLLQKVGKSILNQAKTHFLSHLGEKKRKNMARSGFEPTISRSEVDHANHYSIGN